MLTQLFGTTKSSGDAAERIAEQFLLEQGLKLVTRNYRCRHGEIDLIMMERDMLVFVEVRMRRTLKGNDFGGAAASITATKQARIVAAAQHYLAGMKRLPPCRFDAVLMNTAEKESVEWMKGAFEA